MNILTTISLLEAAITNTMAEEEAENMDVDEGWLHHGPMTKASRLAFTR